MPIDFKKISQIFYEASSSVLLEHEVYALLQLAGMKTPEYLFNAKGRQVTEKDLSRFPSSPVVLKIVSPSIVHKTDVGGVWFVEKDLAEVNRAIQDMLGSVPKKYLEWIKRSEDKDHWTEWTEEAIRDDILGVLLCESIDHEHHGFGSEILLGLRTSREFGPVVTMGVGGVDVEYMAERIKEGKAVAIGAAHLLKKDDVLSVLEELSFFEKFTGTFRGRKPLLSADTLAAAFDGFLQLGVKFSSLNAVKDIVIEEFEVNPFVISKGKLVALDGMCRFSKNSHPLEPRPFEKIKHVLEPKTIGIIGVSEKMNLGRIILKNILKNGFPAENVSVIKPGMEEIDGCRCVPDVSSLSGTLDLFVITVSADQSYDVMKDIVELEKARSVIIIAGGLGEKKGTQSLEKDIKDLLAESRRVEKLTPVVNGGNCLGIFSSPGRYDTTFVPDHKLYALPREGARQEKLALISQSGAFMISRMSKFPNIIPAYAISIGNQIDLTASDYLNYLKDRKEADVFAVYLEGFLPGDGLVFARAVKDCVNRGKKVIVYKAGRTPEGKAATASHTASVAGDYWVARAVLEEAGAIMTEDIFEFESYIKKCLFLAGKKIHGKRVGLVSNAGFECVIMSDNIKGDEELELAHLSPETIQKISEILKPLGIDRLQDVRNPVDTTPVADDETFAGVVDAVLKDQNVDCAVVSPLPMSPAMQTLVPSKHHKEDLFKEGSIARRLVSIFNKTSKPMVISIDTGAIYQPMVDMMEAEGVPVFRHCDEAVRFLRKYIHATRRSPVHHP